jgi:hypothetical protein
MLVHNTVFCANATTGSMASTCKQRLTFPVVHMPLSQPFTMFQLGQLDSVKEDRPWAKGMMAITSGLIFYGAVGLRHLEGGCVVPFCSPLTTVLGFGLG